METNFAPRGSEAVAVRRHSHRARLSVCLVFTSIAFLMIINVSQIVDFPSYGCSIEDWRVVALTSLSTRDVLGSVPGLQLGHCRQRFATAVTFLCWPGVLPWR